MNRIRRILWALEDNADRIVYGIVNFFITSLIWGGLVYLLFAGEFK